MVLLYDYCLSACANYVLVATNSTYVLKDTVVAWHGGPPTNGYLSDAQCSGSDREQVRREYARHYGTEADRMVKTLCQTSVLIRTYFQDRQIDNRHIYKPQTDYTQKNGAPRDQGNR